MPHKHFGTDGSYEVLAMPCAEKLGSKNKKESKLFRRINQVVYKLRGLSLCRNDLQTTTCKLVDIIPALHQSDSWDPHKLIAKPCIILMLLRHCNMIKAMIFVP